MRAPGLRACPASSLQRSDALNTRPTPLLRRLEGFTLLEILVVMVIIGILATMVSLSISGRAVDDRMQAESRRVEELMRLASDQAQALGIELGFRQTTAGFEFLTPDTNSGEWSVLEDGTFRRREVPSPFYLELRVDGRLVVPAKPAPMPTAKDAAEDGKDEASITKKEKDKEDGNRLEPQVLILSTGEMTAFTLDLRLKDVATTYRVEGNALGELKSERLATKEELAKAKKKG